MPTAYVIITGTSRGVGEALAKNLLEDGHYVHGISRGQSDALAAYSRYSHEQFDLSHPCDMESLFDNLVKRAVSTAADMICLVNNAAIVQPLKPIEKCEQEEVQSNLQLNLIAPIMTTSSFMRVTHQLSLRRKVVNITSSAGVYPLPDMGAYCTSKAGLNMFTRCVGAEQSHSTNPVEIVAVDPGMVETQMQQTARDGGEGFAMQPFFDNAFQNGELRSANSLAIELKRIIFERQEPGRIMNYADQ